MPYLAHFSLREHPFSLTPNTQHYFPTEGSAEVLQSLEFGLWRSSGIMKVVGDVGTGKTLLCRLLLRLVHDRMGVAYINAPQADLDSLIGTVCHEFGVARGARADMMASLNTFLLAEHARGRDCVLLVDEAQALGPEGLEAVRLLSNLETERRKLLQIVLFGQAELDTLLAHPSLRQINQRIAFSFSTNRLSEDEARGYIDHRVNSARIPGVEWPVFDPAATTALVKAAGGTPRVINILCDKALLVAYGDGARAVNRDHAQAAIKDSPSLVAVSAPVAVARAVLPRGRLNHNLNPKEQQSGSRGVNGERRMDRQTLSAYVAGAVGVIVGAGLAAWMVGGEPLRVALTGRQDPAAVSGPSPASPPVPAASSPQPSAAKGQPAGDGAAAPPADGAARAALSTAEPVAVTAATPLASRPTAMAVLPAAAAAEPPVPPMQVVGGGSRDLTVTPAPKPAPPAPVHAAAPPRRKPTGDVAAAEPAPSRGRGKVAATDTLEREAAIPKPASPRTDARPQGVQMRSVTVRTAPATELGQDLTPRPAGERRARRAEDGRWIWE